MPLVAEEATEVDAEVDDAGGGQHAHKHHEDGDKGLWVGSMGRCGRQGEHVEKHDPDAVTVARPTSWRSDRRRRLAGTRLAH